MTRTPSDAARDGCGAEGEPATESEAVEAAKRILSWPQSYESFDLKWDTPKHKFPDDVTLVARALLSLSSRLETAREEMKEECAKVADVYTSRTLTGMAHAVGNRDAEYRAKVGRLIASKIAERIRSLSVKAKP